MTEMIERVARAIEPLLFASGNPKHRAAAIDKAFYAIAAMREPTEAMVKCGENAGWSGVIDGIAADERNAARVLWQRMIDAEFAD